MQSLNYDEFFSLLLRNRNHQLLFAFDMKTNDTILMGETGWMLQLTVSAFTPDGMPLASYQQSFIPSNYEELASVKILPSAVATYGKPGLDPSSIEPSKEYFSKFNSLMVFILESCNTNGSIILAYSPEYIADALNASSSFGPKFHPEYQEMLSSKSLSLMLLAEKLIPVSDIGDFRPASLYCYFFGQEKCIKYLQDKWTKNMFNGEFDNVILAVLFMKLADKAGISGPGKFSKLIKFQHEPIMIGQMPFGKFKGWKLLDIYNMDNGRYFKFMLSDSKFKGNSPDLEYSMRKIIEEGEKAKND